MENKDQITALAREYAEECTNPSGFSKATYEEMVEERTENVTYVLRWLLRRYCLVEKSKMLEEYKSAKYDNKIARQERLPAMLAVASARKALLESLIPEIGKEVEG